METNGNLDKKLADKMWIRGKIFNVSISTFQLDKKEIPKQVKVDVVRKRYERNSKIG